MHRAAFAPAYWSSRGCLFHHAYPVGYVARKTHFGRDFVMTIERSETGPVFRVTDEESGDADAQAPSSDPLAND